MGGGKGTLTPAGPGPGARSSLGPRGFAALYAGTPLATLRRAGLAAGGDPGGDAALDARVRRGRVHARILLSRPGRARDGSRYLLAPAGAGRPAAAGNADTPGMLGAPGGPGR